MITYPAIAILAGGESRRMGTDKAALDIGGMTLLERTARVALSINISVTVAGRSRRVARIANHRVMVIGRSHPDHWPLAFVDFLEDTTPGLGPLGGLATALRYAEAPTLALACDLPLLTTEALRWLRQQYRGLSIPVSNLHGLIVVNHGQWEPLFSIYRPDCLPLIESRLAEGKRSLHGLIESGQFAFIGAPDWVSAQLLNVNTPEDWAHSQKSERTTEHNAPPSVL